MFNMKLKCELLCPFKTQKISSCTDLLKKYSDMLIDTSLKLLADQLRT